MDLAVLLSNLVGLFLLIGVGFFAVRGKLLPAEASKSLSTLLVKVTLPATILYTLIRPFDPEFLKMGAVMLLLGVVSFSLFGVLSLGLSKLFQVPEGRRGMWCFCCTFCNNGFMGFPIALALFGDVGLTLTVILSIPSNVLAYSAGIKMVCMDVPEGKSAQPISWRKAIFSSINLAMAAGLTLYLTQLPLPQAILAPLGYLSDITTPLSMVVIGMNLSQGRIADVVRDRDVFTVSFTRLLLFPLLVWALAGLTLRLDAMLVGAALINLAMPAPAIATILGEEYGGCTQLAARAVFFSSLLCIVTIPLVSLLL